MSQQVIYTIDARDYILFDVFKKMGATDASIYDHIFSSFNEMVSLLKTKGIIYDDLKNALVPTADKREICLFFDASKTKAQSVYGVEIMDLVIPLLKEIDTCSVLHGDYIFWNRDNENRISALEKAIKYSNFSDIRQTRVLCVYINNLSESAFESIKMRLSDYPVYIGFVDATRASNVKWYLSFMLPGLVKHKNFVIMSHEEDRDNGENVNMTIYPFGRHGHIPISLQEGISAPFLSYKIERPVFPGYEIDEEMAFVALSGHKDSFLDYSVEISLEKLGYLKDKKSVNLQNAGIDNFDKDQLCELLKQNLRNNYIFNFKIAPDGAMCFGTIVEIPREEKESYRLTVAMKIDQSLKRAIVTSLY
ncbi:MAG: hypothetical protein K9M46_01865 [Candidatus Pacebacteria bacterium]|nr:hypothetical protein [Candidatus Paceibacterota bacterium]